MDYLVIGALFKQENCWLDEWIHYHTAVGIERFYLYCHDEDPRIAQRILKPYIEKGLVKMAIVTDNTVLKTLPSPEVHPAVCREIINETINKTRWLAIVDLDEFLLPRTNDDLRTILQHYETFSALTVNWHIFGSSEHIRRPPTQINHFLYRAENNHPMNLFVKSIIHPETVELSRIMERKETGIVPHKFPYQKGIAVDEYFRPSDNSHYNSCTFDKIGMNHYITRSYQDFWEIKAPRGRLCGLPDHDEDWWEKLDRNEVYDNEISQRFGHVIQ
jgi:hypothetical protein